MPGQIDSVSRPHHRFFPDGEGERPLIIPWPPCLPPALCPWGKWAEPELNISNQKLSENSP